MINNTPQQSTFKQPILKQSGLASVEMVIITPILLIIMMGVFEITQIIQANNIIISVSREGANLISRNSTQTPEQVMDIVASTSNPLNLANDGTIYISLVVGRGDDSSGNPQLPYINNQYRWQDGNYSTSNTTWDSCSTWVDGECQLPTSNKPELANFPLALDEGESVYVVEVIYKYSPISTYIFDSDFSIRELTYL
ncbi:TadE/TadG family type IV pilus assembly protein [Vibrio gallicus]|uniref:TadE/TadG family type IV pilus assembly protein n=1 Tax=Vibrio gallicus TaxID=190897 RepID=UPI0021C2E07C|nr:TadE/TadG family type IV pilus assembly protein [Vibrio gallicus]